MNRKYLLILVVIMLLGFMYLKKQYGINHKEILLADAIIQGDVNGDGKISSIDYIIVRKKLLGQMTLDDNSTMRADMNNDGKISSADYIMIRKVILNGATNYSVSSISLNKASTVIKVGSSETLIATINPNNATNKTVTWTSSDSKVATVTNGKVVGVKAGTVAITVKSDDGGFTDTCRVTITDNVVNVGGIKLNKTSTVIKAGENETLVAILNPTDATNQNVTWTSSDSKVATVTNGKVVGVKAGTVTITVKSDDGGFTDTCTVTVNEVDVTNISLNKTSMTIGVGKNETLTATITPTDATNKTVTWTSSDSKVATVTNGKVVGVKKGTATITAESSNGEKATCSVTVNEIDVTKISLNKTSMAIGVGKNETLTATITPTDATYKTVTWTSSNTSVATVTNGKVVGVKKGTATITAQSSNGKKATCSVTINPVNEWVDTGNGYIYYGANGEKYINKWLNVDNKSYYFGSDGISYCGKWLQYNNDWYYFSNSYRCPMATNYAITENRQPPADNPYANFVYKYYVGSDGKRAINKFVKLNSEQMGYAGADGVIVNNQWFKVNGKAYYAYYTGTLYCNTPSGQSVIIGGKAYRFDSSCACINC